MIINSVWGKSLEIKIKMTMTLLLRPLLGDNGLFKRRDEEIIWTESSAIECAPYMLLPLGICAVSGVAVSLQLKCAHISSVLPPEVVVQIMISNRHE